MTVENVGLGKWAQLAQDFFGSDFFHEVLTPDEKDEKDNYPADVYHTENEIIVLVNLPGVKSIDALNWAVIDDQLELSGIYPDLYPDYTAVLSERKKGAFKQSISLGATAEPKHTHARYCRGILELHFPFIKQDD